MLNKNTVILVDLDWVIFMSLSEKRLSYFTINGAARMFFFFLFPFYWVHYIANEMWRLVKANWIGDEISVSVSQLVTFPEHVD